jgi:hypothetical protein
VPELPQLEALPVEPERQPLPERAGEAGRVAPFPLGRYLVACLEGRDLGQVEDVAQVHAVARRLDEAVLVDREVAEGMRRRDGGNEQRKRESG